MVVGVKRLEQYLAGEVNILLFTSPLRGKPHVKGPSQLKEGPGPGLSITRALGGSDDEPEGPAGCLRVRPV